MILIQILIQFAIPIPWSLYKMCAFKCRVKAARGTKMEYWRKLSRQASMHARILTNMCEFLVWLDNIANIRYCCLIGLLEWFKHEWILYETVILNALNRKEEYKYSIVHFYARCSLCFLCLGLTINNRAWWKVFMRTKLEFVGLENAYSLFSLRHPLSGYKVHSADCLRYDTE